MTPYLRSLLGFIGVAVLIAVSTAQQPPSPQQPEQPPKKKPDLGPMVTLPENTIIKLDPNDPNLEV